MGSILLPTYAAEEVEKIPPEVRGTKTGEFYHGPIEIWATPSHKQAEGNFSHGLPDGKWTFWDAGGTKIVEFNYRAGTFSGAVKMFFPPMLDPACVVN
jgi:hypothetical protein